MAKLLPCVVAMVAVLALCNVWLPAFVPSRAGQSLRRGAHLSTAVRASAALGAPPAPSAPAPSAPALFPDSIDEAAADSIDDAATKLFATYSPSLEELDSLPPASGRLPTNANPLEVLQAVYKALVVGGSGRRAA